MVPNELLPYVIPFVALAGLCLGSFLNVVIHRVPIGESIVTPRSRCPGCRAPIPAWRNIPLLSYALQRGRCAGCGMRISARYPLVELVTGLLVTAACVVEPRVLAWPFHAFFVCALVASTFIDLDHWILPDVITLPGIVVGFASALVAPHHLLIDGPWSIAEFSNPFLHAGLESLSGILLGGGLLYAVAWGYYAFSGKDGLGGGDIKFLAMVGAFLGAKGALVTLILSSFVGSVLGLFLIAFRGKNGSTAIPFGPFLAGGALAAFFFGAPLWRWYFT